MEPLEILYQHAQVVAVHKPAGLLVHRSPIDRRETRFAVQLLRDQLGRQVYPLHRLDKPTSGILLFALSPEAARPLARAFACGEVHKSYLAVVRGFAAEAGVIDYPLRPLQERGGILPPLAVRPAITAYRRLATVELPIATGRYASSRYSLILAQPKTGRRHQLRRHFKHIFHPIVGDTRYGDGRHNRLFREQLDCEGLLLTAVGVGFCHPLTGRRVTISTTPPPAFSQVLHRLGWSPNLSAVALCSPCAERME